MNWRLTFSRNAQKSLRRLQAEARRRLDGAIAEMERDPLAGDVVLLKDYPVGYRRRVGPYRILFDIDRATHSVQIQDIERRTSTSYRRRS
ncbi:MAG TPA: type II toxin-antitoxin system RelE/ParE family toxin [Geminicoccaceae bacterium]|nr:type II toxin-antitoxin system RelE/ParE family toxin [Geminicoccaceae bacterium]